MTLDFFSNKYLIFLLAFFSPMIISIGGEVSPSFLFILVTFPFWWKYLHSKTDRILKQFLQLFGIIIGVQVLWAPFAATDFFIQIKGIMVTVSGLLFFMYYYVVYQYDKNVVKWAVLGDFLSSFVFINVLAERAGGEFGMWKFQIMPRLVSLTALIYLWTISLPKIKKLAPLMFLFIGGLGVVTGARSCGLVPFMAGVVGLFVQRSGIRKLKKYIIFGGLTLYLAYALLYVPNVLNGTIAGGNTDQLKNVENPYNPLNLLMIGRTDALVPFIAFFDNPITGWGYMTPDPNFKYHILNNKLHSGEFPIEYKTGTDFSCYTIPRHSVWGYYSCSYGIIIFIVLFLLLCKTWKYCYRSMISQDSFLQYRIFVVIEFIWNFLFSPMAHFKTLPMSMAIVVVFSAYAINSNKQCME